MRAQILVIDDSLDDVAVYAGALKECNVIMVTDTQAVNDLISSVDLVISDYWMPYKKFEAIRRQCDANGTPLILVSGDADIVSAGVHPHSLLKPVRVTSLRTLVSELLATGGVATRARTLN